MNYRKLRIAWSVGVTLAYIVALILWYQAEPDSFYLNRSLWVPVLGVAGAPWLSWRLTFREMLFVLITLAGIFAMLYHVSTISD